jgi:hypothetical protein
MQPSQKHALLSRSEPDAMLDVLRLITCSTAAAYHVNADAQ